MAAIRCFVALDPSPQVLAEMAAVARDLAECGADVRWSREQALHCTLKFLGSVEEERIAAIGDALTAALSGAPAFAAAARGLGVFPSWRDAHVVWVGLEDADDRCGSDAGLAALARRVDAALAPLGFPAETRPFRAHLTLGRVRSRRGWARLAERMRRLEGVDCGTFRVARVVFYRSQPGSGGSVYTPLAAVGLADRQP